MSEEEECDVCIIGAGYAGLAALVAASENPAAGRVAVVVDRRLAWGGQWVDQYDFARLHQPHRHFTAGSHGWKLDRPRGHLATRKEVLVHFEDVARRAGRRIDVRCLFGHECQDCREVLTESSDPGGHNVVVNARSVHFGRRVRIRAKKVVRATALDIKIKEPLTISSRLVVSASVVDPKVLLDPEIRTGERTVYVIGSGKTAMDYVCELARRYPENGPNIVLIAGRGTYFAVRDKLFHPSSRWFRGIMVSDLFYDFCTDWDGENQVEILRRFERKGILCSPVPDAQVFMFGILSREECKIAKQTLKNVVKDHLEDVVDGPDGRPIMKLRSGDSFPIELGSLIVNCSDHIVTPQKEALLSPHGHVLYPQICLIFPGPSAYFLSHLFLRGKAQQVAHKLYFGTFSGEPKSQVFVRASLTFLANLLIVLPHLPLSVLLKDKSNFNTWYPMPRQAASFVRLLRRRGKIMRKARELGLEQYDEPQDPNSSPDSDIACSG